MSDYYYPNEENLGENCRFWRLEETLVGCCFPKAELMGRMSCEGMIDDVCLFVKNGRPTNSLSNAQMLEIKLRVPDLQGNHLPPGDIQ